jgi:lipoprotein-anchoring transpeptidase ErfK/SrfK
MEHAILARAAQPLSHQHFAQRGRHPPQLGGQLRGARREIAIKPCSARGNSRSCESRPSKSPPSLEDGSPVRAAAHAAPDGQRLLSFHRTQGFLEGTVTVRKIIAGAGAAVILALTTAASTTPASAAISSEHTKPHPTVLPENVAPGTIVVSVSQRRLFLVQNDGTTISYPVAVPKHGKEWLGVTSIREKFTNPDWTPPADVRADHPELPEMISGGAPNNPMGTRAMLLDGDQVAIHGTTSKMRPPSARQPHMACIRMRNEDVTDLYDRVSAGATVIMEP